MPKKVQGWHAFSLSKYQARINLYNLFRSFSPIAYFFFIFFIFFDTYLLLNTGRIKLNTTLDYERKTFYSFEAISFNVDIFERRSMFSSVVVSITTLS